ncbi:MAG: universal stress protein [Deltaproteobacteria bacterium]|nr:universal stress protein [Deltaproteobacteria bacterium]
MDSQHPRYRIIVGHDLEASGSDALDHAAALARRIENSEIHVVHVVPDPSSARGGIAENDRRLDEALVQLRSRVTGALALDRGVSVHAHVRFGAPVETIVQVAVDYDADVIVVGTHGRTGLDRLASGSVSAELARTAPLPVLVAHAKDFTQHPKSQRPDPAQPGEELHDQRTISEVIMPPDRTSHIAGLV